MIGKVYRVDSASGFSVLLDGWHFDNDVVKLIERDGKAIATDNATECRDNPDDSSRQDNRDTLSRREQFAMAAMQGLFYHPDLYDNSPDTHAENAVAYADALIAALDAGEAGND